ncbi:hypothetical protein BCR43DRAFT_486457 [Syncephalastrum racemosum]|uniref:WRKY domain-containing protein n=1 Tax=Syncephalastrum racemosum TaxID=13706 RepID=A0A1X2HP66_SYNRA|nr:hypothetical protein BCR43DRAFT_486457 [Syncephalastrum racemosum]
MEHYTSQTPPIKLAEADNPSAFDLQDLVQEYKAQPDLLKLILTSKVEEDKRRAAEAKLRAKELDLHYRRSSSPSLPSPSPSAISTCPFHHHYHPYQSEEQKLSLDEPSFKSVKRRISSDHAPRPSPNGHMRKASRSSISSEESSIEDHLQRRNSAAAAMVALSSERAQTPPKTSSSSSSSIATLTATSSSFGPVSTSSTSSSSSVPPSSASVCSTTSSASSCSPATPESSGTYAYASPDPHEMKEDSDKDERPRRRREMQAITKIVETREFPYQDNYFWKNNGNTTQKKTGCKSIYYKCSNSNKGCPVNKTVTARLNGEYLIKYRGMHLSECGRVERVRDL